MWASSFFILKETVLLLPAAFVLMLRFLIAFILLFLLFFRRISENFLECLPGSVAAGVLLFATYAFQTYGLIFTTPGKNAFLSSVYCIIVPLISGGAAVRRRMLLPAAVSLCGILLIIGGDAQSPNTGDLLSALSSVFFALYIITVSKSKSSDAIASTAVQFFTVTLLFMSVYFLFSDYEKKTDPVLLQSSVPMILYLAVFCTAGALLLQNIGQKTVSPFTSSLILSFESVSATLFSVVFAGETLSVRLIIGFAVIFFGLMISVRRIEIQKNRDIRRSS